MNAIRKLSLMDLLVWNTAFPSATRAILKSFAGSLNSRIIILMQQHLREERTGKPDTEVDVRTEANGAGADTGSTTEGSHSTTNLEAEHREEVGFSGATSPLEVAGRLKCLRDYVASVLLENARIMTLPGGRKGPDEFHLAASIENSLSFKAQAGPRVDMAKVKQQAQIFGIDENALVEREKSSNLRLRAAVMRDYERLVEMFGELRSIGADGHELEVEASFDLLHPVDQERVLISLDRAAFGHYTTCVSDIVRGGRKDAEGDAIHVNGYRWEIRDCFDSYMSNPRFKRLIEEVETRPQWLKEPMKQIGDRKVA